MCRALWRKEQSHRCSRLANAEITADPALDTNTTFQTFARMLAGQDYDYNEIAINRTLTGAMANITYATAEGKKAWVNATTEDDRVVQVGMELEDRASWGSR